MDGQSIAEFEANLSGNLYKLWNRMSSGSYFPLPVLRVDIPKADGGMRPLGIQQRYRKRGTESVAGLVNLRRSYAIHYSRDNSSNRHERLRSFGSLSRAPRA